MTAPRFMSPAEAADTVKIVLQAIIDREWEDFHPELGDYTPETPREDAAVAAVAFLLAEAERAVDTKTRIERVYLDNHNLGEVFARCAAGIEAAESLVARMEEALRDRLASGHDDTCSSMLGEYECDCGQEAGQDALGSAGVVEIGQ